MTLKSSYPPNMKHQKPLFHREFTHLWDRLGGEDYRDGMMLGGMNIGKGKYIPISKIIKIYNL